MTRADLRHRTSGHLPALLLALVLLPGLPSATAAQSAASPPSAESGSSVEAHGALLLGQSGMGSPAHRWAGLNGGVLRGRWGASGEVHRGSGNGFASTYLGLGPVVRHSLHPRLELRGFAGLAHYRESLDRDRRTRGVTGPTAGVQLRTPVGPLVLLLGATGWLGSHDGEDTPAGAIPGRGMRLVLGVGR